MYEKNTTNLKFYAFINHIIYLSSSKITFFYKFRFNIFIWEFSALLPGPLRVSEEWNIAPVGLRFVWDHGRYKNIILMQGKVIGRYIIYFRGLYCFKLESLNKPNLKNFPKYLPLFFFSFLFSLNFFLFSIFSSLCRGQKDVDNSLKSKSFTWSYIKTRHTTWTLNLLY